MQELSGQKTTPEFPFCTNSRAEFPELRRSRRKAEHSCVNALRSPLGIRAQHRAAFGASSPDSDAISTEEIYFIYEKEKNKNAFTTFFGTRPNGTPGLPQRAAPRPTADRPPRPPSRDRSVRSPVPQQAPAALSDWLHGRGVTATEGGPRLPACVARRGVAWRVARRGGGAGRALRQRGAGGAAPLGPIVWRGGGCPGPAAILCRRAPRRAAGPPPTRPPRGAGPAARKPMPARGEAPRGARLGRRRRS